jgi:branched-chain amino acid transport system substrate-binding protein
VAGRRDRGTALLRRLFSPPPLWQTDGRDIPEPREKDADNVRLSDQYAGARRRPARTRYLAAFAASAAVGVMTLAACASNSSGGTGPGASGSSGGTLNLVAFDPFSGSDASYGPLALSGCYPAVHLINAAGGVLGHQLACTSSDTRGDPQDAVPAANALSAHSGDDVAVLGPSSDEILSTIGILERAQLPSFAMSGDTQFDHQTSRYFWRLVPPDADEGYAMAAWATKHGFTRAAAVFASGSQAQADGPASQSGFKALGGQIVVNVSLAPGQPSYSTEAAQVAAAHPQVIFYDAGAPESATFLAELKQQMSTLPPTYVVETEEEPGWVKAVTGAIGASGLSSFTAFEAATPAATQPGWQTFSRALGTVGSQVPDSTQYLHDPFTLSYYDASNLVALAMLEAHSTKPADFNHQIMGLTQPGAGKTVVNNFEAGKKALAEGKQIQYVGALGPIALDKYHNIATPFVALTEGASPKQVGAVPTDLMVKAAG